MTDQDSQSMSKIERVRRRQTYGLHFARWEMPNLITDCWGLDDEALDDLRPDDWSLINGHERPGTTEE